MNSLHSFDYLSPNPTVILTDKAPDKYSLYRAQRMIRMGEWLDRHEFIIEAIHDNISNYVSQYMDDPDESCYYMDNMVTADLALVEVLQSYRAHKKQLGSFDEFIEKEVVTLHHPMACKDHEHTFIARIPKESITKSKSTTTPKAKKD